MSSKKKNLFRTVCYGGCGCGKPKAFEEEVHEPTPNPKISSINHKNATTYPSSMASYSFTTSHNCDFSMEDEDSISTTIPEFEIIVHNNNNSPNNTLVTKQSPLMDSLAVEKNSSDPYRDFRHSMLQMIFEKEIDSEDDLRDLLRCFLQLNAPHYHLIIVEAFNQICEEAFPEKVNSIGRSPISQGNHIIIRKNTH